jgi:myotubularin-related protein 6/7/8
LYLILTGALDIANNLAKGINCLAHCSDGWDRTSQLCSLSSLLLDPFYRTMKGFMTLVEKDWVYFGHQFSKRLGHFITDEVNS